jgi:hypothetical protein
VFNTLTLVLFLISKLVTKNDILFVWFEIKQIGSLLEIHGKKKT